MELIIFACLYQAKEVLYFYTHFLIEEPSIYVPGRSDVAFPLYKQDFGGRKLGGPWTLSGDALRAGSERLNPTSGSCIRLSYHVDMHKRSFLGPLEVSFCGLEDLWRSLPTSRSRPPGGKHEENFKTIRS